MECPIVWLLLNVALVVSGGSGGDFAAVVV